MSKLSDILKKAGDWIDSNFKELDDEWNDLQRAFREERDKLLAKYLSKRNEYVDRLTEGITPAWLRLVARWLVKKGIDALLEELAQKEFGEEQ